jgi:hypothetical protein
MRILRIRPGFQADHSSSSYLFYAVDQPVSAAGQRVAHRFSSRAEVDEQFASYQKWGESSLSPDAFPALLGEHYDVMASESYDSWTLMIAVPKTPQMEQLLRPFHDLDDGEFTRLDVHDYRKRLVVEVYGEFDAEGPLWNWGEDVFEELVELLAEIRKELLQGNVSFLEAVAQFYGAGTEDEEDGGSEATAPPFEPPAEWTRVELQQECTRRGVEFRKSWTKDQLREALAAAAAPTTRPGHGGKPPKLSPAARRIVDSLTHR